MPNFTNPKVWVNGEALLFTALNLLGQALETFFNVTKLSSTNIQVGGISLGNLANPYATRTFTLQAAEGGTGSGRALPDFQLYSEVLDEVTMLGPGVIVGMSVVGATQAAGPAQEVQLWRKTAGVVESLIAGSTTAVLAAGVGTIPNTQTLNEAYLAGDAIRLKMTGAVSLANLPVNVTVYVKENHRS